ncbi:hypothetical protein CLF_107858 [Clonorchis sinensis]|uniref:Uncharacterized protein n=1 Tax=Clonorchis sinensis TaxID=79923 RepID=G7YH98_CLOSI|nr:hypothetical protein CLF_107858 [Clonorchis sinensis]
MSWRWHLQGKYSRWNRERGGMREVPRFFQLEHSYRSTWLMVDDGGRASPCIRFRMVVYRSVGGLPGVQVFRAASWRLFAKTPRCLYTTQSIEERYEALQALCRQLMMGAKSIKVNETLKSELTRLTSVYQKAFSERRTNLPCRRNFVDYNLRLRTVVSGDRSHGSTYIIFGHYRLSGPLPFSGLSVSTKLYGRRLPDSVAPPHGVVECVSNLWSEQDPEDEFSPSSSETPLPSHSSGSHGLPMQSNATTYGTTPASRWQSVESSKSPPTVSLSMESSPSMSLFTTAQQQRPTKQPSLVTSSVVSSSGTGVSYIHSGPRSSLAGFQNVKNFPVVSRSVSIIQTSNVSRPVVPMSVVLSPTSPALLNTQTAIRGARTVQSPQTTATLRFTGPPSGQRIVIQPPSGNARSLLVQSSENVLRSTDTRVSADQLYELMLPHIVDFMVDRQLVSRFVKPSMAFCKPGKLISVPSKTVDIAVLKTATECNKFVVCRTVSETLFTDKQLMASDDTILSCAHSYEDKWNAQVMEGVGASSNHRGKGSGTPEFKFGLSVDVLRVLQIDKVLTSNGFNTEVLKTFERSHYFFNDEVEQEWISLSDTTFCVARTIRNGKIRLRSNQLNRTLTMLSRTVTKRIQINCHLINGLSNLTNRMIDRYRPIS